MNKLNQINLLKSVLFSFILIFAFYVVLSALLTILLNSSDFAFVLPFLQILSFIIIPVIITKKNEWEITSTFKLTMKFRFSYLFSAISVIIGFSIFNVGYISFVDNLLKGDNLLRFHQLIEKQVFLMDKLFFHSDIKVVIAATISILITAPIAEEMLFRGFLLSPLESAIKRREAIALSAGLFALIHMNAAIFPVLFTLGLILGYFASYTKSIFPPIFIHFANNLIAYLNTQFIYKPEIKALNKHDLSFEGSVLFLIFGLFIIIYSIYYLKNEVGNSSN